MSNVFEVRIEEVKSELTPWEGYAVIEGHLVNTHGCYLIKKACNIQGVYHGAEVILKTQNNATMLKLMTRSDFHPALLQTYVIEHFPQELLNGEITLGLYENTKPVTLSWLGTALAQMEDGLEIAQMFLPDIVRDKTVIDTIIELKSVWFTIEKDL